VWKNEKADYTDYSVYPVDVFGDMFGMFRRQQDRVFQSDLER